MELFIQVKDGSPFEHPIIGDNFRQAFPDVDVDNLPPIFARFTRVPKPEIGVYQVYEGVTYGPSEDGFCDVHQVREMTEEEKQAKQQQVKDAWAIKGYASWTFDETTCAFIPPVPKPEDGKMYAWVESTQSWLDIIEDLESIQTSTP